jgi:hypothetical protein
LPFKLLLNMPLGLTSIGPGIRGPNFFTYPGPKAIELLRARFPEAHK